MQPPRSLARGRLLAGAAALASVATLAACGNSSTQGSADMAVGPDMARVRPDLWMPTACVKGVIGDETGSNLSSTSVLGCSAEICLYGTTALDGSFKICGLKLVHLAMKIEEDLTKTPRHAEAICPARPMTQDQVLDIGNLTVPLLGAGANIPDIGSTSPISLAVGDGLTVTLTPKELVYPIGFSAPDNVAARLVPPGKRCNGFVVPDGGPIVAVYALSPFATTAHVGGALQGALSKSIRFSAMVTPAPTKGAEVHFWSVSELDGQLEGPAVGHAVDDAGTVSTDPGQGLSEISWLVLSTTK